MLRACCTSLASLHQVRAACTLPCFAVIFVLRSSRARTADAETALARVTYNNLLLNFQTNTFGPVLVTKVCAWSASDLPLTCVPHVLHEGALPQAFAPLLAKASAANSAER
jgi:hypothetical protein